jgi:surfeit locus 1 family protein
VLNTMAVSALINRWQDMTGHDVYGGYVIAGDPAEVGQVDGLVAIDAPPPVPETTVNWLNIFYAVEWVVFAGFAVFLWYRLVRDTWEREYEEKLLASGAGPEPVRVD